LHDGILHHVVWEEQFPELAKNTGLSGMIAADSANHLPLMPLSHTWMI
jgi:hypothetical protein